MNNIPTKDQSENENESVRLSNNDIDLYEL